MYTLLFPERDWDDVTIAKVFYRYVVHVGGDVHALSLHSIVRPFMSSVRTSSMKQVLMRAAELISTTALGAMYGILYRLVACCYLVLCSMSLALLITPWMFLDRDG